MHTDREAPTLDVAAHSRPAVVACQDLLRLHLDDQAAGVRGTIEERHRNGRTWLYERFRIGTAMHSRYLGEDSPALRARLNRAATLKAGAEARRKQMARLTRTLRAEGFIPTDRETGSLLLAFSRTGVFRLGGVWKWRQSQSQTLVGFLTPAFGDETVKPLPALGVSAQGLNCLDFLIADPIGAVALYRSGVLVQIPRPERFAIHKLIVADRRRGGPDRLKARKDRAQAAFLIEVLAEDRPDDLAEAYDDALSRGPRWRARIAASLVRMPKAATRLTALV